MAGRRSHDDGGPLKLAHDVTPIDPGHIRDLSNSQEKQDGQFRFQGFPDNSFSDSRKPIIGLVKWEGQDNSYRKAQHFVKGAPPSNKGQVVGATNGSQHINTEQQISRPVEMHSEGILYGSGGLSNSNTISTPKKTLFLLEDKTSAEAKKRLKQTQDAEWDLSRARQEKCDKQNKQAKEKKEDLQMLINYQPWGHPGAGAPVNNMTNNRRTKVMEPSQLGDGETTSYFPAFGKPGNGAPLRTNSGTVITNVRASHDIRFLTTKGMSEHASMKMRYAQPKKDGQKYIEELGQLAEQKRLEKEKEKSIDFEDEKFAIQYNPFGKQGGGAPLKTESGNLRTGRARSLVKNHYEMREVEQKQLARSRRSSLADDKDIGATDVQQYNPWGKGQGMPDRDSLGNVRRFKWADRNNVQEYIDPTAEGGTLQTKTVGGGGHRANEKGERMTRFKATLMHDRNSGEHAVIDSSPGEASDPSDPWGKPGAGAPILNGDGKAVTVKTGQAYYDKLGVSEIQLEEQHARRQYLTALKKEIDNHKALRQQENGEYRTSGREVATWIREKEIGYPKRDPNSGEVLPVHHKHTSDVTQQRMDIRRASQFADPQEYHTDLSKQAEQRYEMNRLHKAQSRDMAQQHQQQFDTLWGKPGNGAPNPASIKRQQLDMEKHAQADRYDQPPWTQPHAQPSLPKHSQWQRTKALDNRFQPQYTAIKPEYKPRAPWAVN